ncbi:SCO1664 family protein [Microbacterium sp. A93]|uniref:SCO1664 family protein n=1 Tax=Microbacterium sp. A93 TaxID=3450716 RepID=UPI003F434668
MDGCEERLALLASGSIEVLGQLANSSNETFLVELTAGEPTRESRGNHAVGTHGESAVVRHWAIYKPELGERPLRDFRPGLHRRERAAYLLSEALGWGIVPPTVIRHDAPFGVGSLQWFVNHDPDRHYFTLFDEGPGFHDQLRRMAVFDLLANNTDRKAGHVLCGEDGRLWGIDHGLCFSASFKLRTVIWDFAGEEIDAGLLADVVGFADVLTETPADAPVAPTGSGERLTEHLTWFEMEALRQRIRDLLLLGVFPDDPTGMRFPWPLV